MVMDLKVRCFEVWRRMDTELRLCSEGQEESCGGANRSEKA